MAQLGKDGLTAGFIAQVDALLETHELVKINVLDGSPVHAKEAADQVAKLTESAFVQAIGKRFVIYRRAREDAKIELPRKK